MAGHDSMLHLSWHDSAWIPILNQGNVMDYFSERSNPFYDRQCSNEIIKMQRLNPEQMVNMIGIEYFLLHAMEPILYVIRQQHRQSPTSVTPLADFYIIAGIVYQAPDLISVVNARLLNAVHSLEGAFEEARSYSQYHPSKGYWWEFKQTEQTDKQNKEKKRKKEESGSVFQRERVDMLLTKLAAKFPPKSQPSVQQPQAPTTTTNVSDKPDDAVKVEPKVEVKLEKMTDRPNPSQGASRPPPEKKPKLIR